MKKSDNSEELQPLSFAFPWENTIRVGDIVGLEEGYVFEGDIFNGKFYGNGYKFLGCIDKINEFIYPEKKEQLEKANYYNQKSPDGIFVFEKLNKKDGYRSFLGGEFFVKTFYEGKYGGGEKKLNISLCFNSYLFADSVEGIIDALAHKNQIHLI